MTASSVEKAKRRGYTAGLHGLPSMPHDFMHSEVQRCAYEKAYDVGRSERINEIGKVERQKAK